MDQLYSVRVCIEGMKETLRECIMIVRRAALAGTHAACGVAGPCAWTLRRADAIVRAAPCRSGKGGQRVDTGGDRSVRAVGGCHGI